MRAQLTALLILAILPFQAKSDDFDMKSVEVKEGSVIDISPGAHIYKSINIHKGGIIRLSGTTSILVGDIRTEEGAGFQYIAGSSLDKSKVFTLNAQDAGGLTTLNVLASGTSGSLGSAGSAGNYGRDARTGTHGIFHPENWSADPGSPGSAGANGSRGEDAMDVQLYLPNLKQGAIIGVEAIGGRGGDGGNGGAGGKGGDGNAAHKPANGANGGAAGSGGGGGRAGKVQVVLILNDDQMTSKDQITSAVHLSANVAGGVGGNPGTPGSGGGRGNGGGICTIMAKQCPADSGQPGAIGNPGSPGAGPIQGEKNPDWVSVDAMTLDQYKQHFAQVWDQFKISPAK